MVLRTGLSIVIIGALITGAVVVIPGLGANIDLQSIDDSSDTEPENIPTIPPSSLLTPDTPTGTSTQTDPSTREELMHPSDEGPSTIPVGTSNMTLNTTKVELALYEEVAEYRNKNNKSDLETSIALASTARSHAQYMEEEDHVSHFTKENTTPSERFDQTGAPGCNDGYGENILYSWKMEPFVDAYENDSLTLSDSLAETFVYSWSESEGHNKLLLSEEYSYIGMGVHSVETEDGYETYAVMNVCGGGFPGR